MLDRFLDNMRFLLVFILQLVGNVLYAEHLTPEQALAKVADSGYGIDSMPDYMLAYTQNEPHDNIPAIYVFCRDNGHPGFVLVAADDVLDNLVLGYSVETYFNPDSIPSPMQWAMRSFAEYVAHARVEPRRACMADISSPESAARAGRRVISPMLTTRWHGAAPFNSMIPIIGSLINISGCLAMPQVMKYHEWPVRGVGSRSYKLAIGGINYGNVTVDFGNTSYDWDNMLDTYNGTEAKEQISAAGTLVYHSIVASEAKLERDGAVTKIHSTGAGLLNYFDYDKSMRFLSRKWFTTEEWDDIIYQQLDNQLPIIYRGAPTDDANGLDFVCDGYDGSQYYHINWGYKGMANGYYNLMALYPYSDNNSVGYNEAQCILADIRPNNGGKLTMAMAIDQSLATDQTSYVRAEGRSITFVGGFYSKTLLQTTFTLGLKLVAADHTEVVVIGNAGLLSYDGGYQTLSVETMRFPEGEYDVYPVFLDEYGNWRNMYYNLDKSKGFVHLVVKPDTISVSDGICSLHWPIYSGWNWVSTCMDEPVSVVDVLVNAERIVGQFDETTNDSLWGFVGGIMQIEPGYGYKVLSASSEDITIKGKLHDIDTRPITLHKGWNWISYPYNESRGLNVITNPDEGDVIVSQSGFSEYYNDDWDGTLDSFAPGLGYMYYTQMAKTVVYDFTVTPSVGNVLSARAMSNHAIDDINVHLYPSTMNIVARLCMDNDESVDGFRVYAMCGNQVRGMGVMHGGIYYITVYGDVPTEISFVLEKDNIVYIADETLTFDADIVGSRKSPYHITVGEPTVIKSLPSSHTYNVYGIDGTVVRRCTSLDDFTTLPRGVYVINGSKVFVK